MHGWCGRKGKDADLVGIHTEEPPCDEIFLDDVHAPHNKEAYTTVCLPASASNKEWPQYESKLTLEQAEMFYHCISSDSSIPIALTKQFTQMALMWATLASLPTMVPWYSSLDHFMCLSPGSLFPSVYNAIR